MSNDVCFLDAGGSSIDRRHLVKALHALQQGRLTLLGKDRNAYCHLYREATGNGEIQLVIKQPRRGSRRTNPDHTFINEYKGLTLAAQAGIPNIPQVHARVRLATEHYLLLGYVPGHHPCPVVTPIRTAHLEKFIGQMTQLDCAALMHYDLNPRNLLIDDMDTSIIDFEFTREEPWETAYSAAWRKHYDDFNVTSNPYFPRRSNIPNFEFRTLHAHVAKLAENDDEALGSLMSDYLKVRSSHHGLMAEQLAAFRPEDLIVSQESSAFASAELAKAIKYEQGLARLMRQPDRTIIAAEYQVMGFRRSVFELGRDAAHSLPKIISALQALRQQSNRPGIDGYVHGLIDCVTRVARSWDAFPHDAELPGSLA